MLLFLLEFALSCMILSRLMTSETPRVSSELEVVDFIDKKREGFSVRDLAQRLENLYKGRRERHRRRLLHGVSR